MSNKENNDLIYNMLGSATSGCLARFPAHPLDTIKAKLQVQQTMLKKNIQGALNASNSSSLSTDPHIQSRILPKIRSNFGLIGKIIAGNPSKYASIYSTTTTKTHHTLHQTQTEMLHMKNTIDAIKKTFLREGIAGFYRGVTISTIIGCPATCLYFSTYEITRRQLSKISYFNKHSSISDFVGGFSAEIVSCLLWVPIDVIKERMQVQSLISQDKRYKSTIDAFKQMIKNEGLNGLYKAYGATIVAFGPFSAIYLTLYEQLKIACLNNFYNNNINSSNSNIKSVNDLPPYIIASCACMSAAFSAIVTNPLDIVKVRMQVQRGGIFEFGYANIFDGLIKIVKHESMGSLFHGTSARVAFWVPNLAINLTLYEACTKFYRNRF